MENRGRWNERQKKDEEDGMKDRKKMRKMERKKGKRRGRWNERKEKEEEDGMKDRKKMRKME